MPLTRFNRAVSCSSAPPAWDDLVRIAFAPLAGLIVERPLRFQLRAPEDQVQIHSSRQECAAALFSRCGQSAGSTHSMHRRTLDKGPFVWYHCKHE